MMTVTDEYYIFIARRLVELELFCLVVWQNALEAM